VADVATPSDGFPAIAAPDALVLVLGSLPSRRSIAERQYYGHPQNAFWPIMEALFGIRGSYSERCEQLVKHRIALWDVLASSVRPGSMDADIDLSSAAANDFGAFLAKHDEVGLIAFNGRKAEQLFRRFVDADAIGRKIELKGLPSTSPAYASMSFSGKVTAWRKVLTLPLDATGENHDRIRNTGYQQTR